MNYDGHVLYSQGKTERIPFAVVSSSHERKALLNTIPAKIKEFLVEIEDRRYFSHFGIDFKSIIRAGLQNIKAGKVVQGGSTITQQLARNLLRNNSRTIYRKCKELYKAMELERSYSKDEILNLYFNNVYFGRNLFGLRTASLFYFGKEPKTLSQIQQIELITLLRGPNYYLNRITETQSRYNRLNKILLDRKVISKNRYVKNKRSKITFKNNALEVFDSKVIPFITEYVHEKDFSIDTTIDINIQKIVSKYVSKSQYPVSIICISRNKVLATASTYGSACPFTSKLNVGSTLKPFLYIHLREQGVSRHQVFNAVSNSLNWPVRESVITKPYLTLAEALQQSNNNAFINACSADLPSAYECLSTILNKQLTEFYPSSLLGATKSGITLNELAKAYSNLFHKSFLSAIDQECLTVLQNVTSEKLGPEFRSLFLKTGTTNNNQERFMVLGNNELVLAISRGENPVNDISKEGSFLESIKRLMEELVSSSRNSKYKWIL